MTVRLNRRSMVTLMGVAPAYLLLPLRRFATIWKGETQGTTPAQPQTMAAKGYRCPPCGLDCDKIIFDKPGVCPNCGMKLIPADGSGSGLKTVAVLVFNGVQIIDFSGPWEVFGAAGFLVHSVAEKLDPVTTVFGEKLVPDFTFENAPKADILLVPGGGVDGPMSNPRVIEWIQANAKETSHVLSVCNGSYLLGQAGLLAGLPATATYRLIDGLREFKATPVRDQRYVDNGKIITTAGLTSGIDGALHLVSKILGTGRAQSVALAIEYHWEPDSHSFVRAALADRNLPGGWSTGKLQIDGVEADVILTEGDRDRWQTKYLVSKPNSPAEILDALRTRLSAGTSYVESTAFTVIPPRSGEADVRWTLIDQEKVSWRGSAAAEPAANEKGKFVLTLSIGREPLVRKNLVNAKQSNDGKKAKDGSNE
jgi:putative intracellular protease/amidase/DNA-directed RNA polymerase subunit RPC12/RpoP